MKYIISDKATLRINDFYNHVARKYKHTITASELKKNKKEANKAMRRIENGLLRRKSTISCWKDYHMAQSGKWYYAYTIDGDTITVVDARHALNMSDKAYKFEESVQMNSAHAMKSLTMFIQEHLKNI